MTEKRVLIAAALSIAFMAAYGQWIAKRYPSAVKPRPAAVTSAATTSAVLTTEESTENEPVTLVRGPGVELEVGERSGSIRRVVLQDFLDQAKQQRVHFGGKFPVLQITGSRPIQWTIAGHSESSVHLLGKSDSKEYHLSYACCNPKYVVNITLDGDIVSGEMQVLTGWSRADNMSGRQNILEAVAITKISPEAKPKHSKVLPGRTPKIVPRGTYQLSLSERYFCQSLKFPAAVQAVIQPSQDHTIHAVAALPDSQGRIDAQLYIGPRDFFYLRDAGFSDAFRVGILGQIGLILLMIITSLASVTKSYGVAIILFAVGITSMMAPFTLMGYRSMKKMQELKPKMDAITAKYKNDPTKANKEMFALYREHKVSPMSGCLPMLLQMPVFIALFQALSHFIQLRGKEFLWIHDLSMPDRLALLPFSIPILGNELNILPIVMAFAMFFQSRLTQVAMPSSETNPTSKMMSGPMMSVIFGFMFYHFPSGLVLYWMCNSLTSMAWYRLAK